MLVKVCYNFPQRGDVQVFVNAFGVGIYGRNRLIQVYLRGKNYILPSNVNGPVSNKRYRAV